MFMKLKKYEVKIKGRRCAYGINKGNWILKEDTSSPNVSTEGLVISCMIDAMEGRGVATADIAGAFLQTDYEKGYIPINTEGAMVNILKEIYPAY